MSGLIARRRIKHSQNRLIYWLESFLAAGSSALLLSVAHLQPEGWWVMLFALVPFLWRALGGSVRDNLALGFLTAICFLAVSGQQTDLVGAQTAWAIVWLGLTLAVFGLACARLSRRVGINPIFIAAAWIPLEYALTSVGGFSCIVAIPPAADMSFLHRFCALFGLLAVSFVIILVNSVILVFLRTVVEKLGSTDVPVTGHSRSGWHHPRKVSLQSNRYSIPCGRAPPAIAFLI